MGKSTHQSSSRLLGPEEIDSAIDGLQDWSITPTKKGRKQKNKLKVAQPAYITTGTTTEEADSAQQPDQQLTPAVPRSLPSTPMSTGRAYSLLVCSVGNPGSLYKNTLHSAGHTVLKKLSERLGFQQFQKYRPLGNGLVSKPLATSEGDWTLWQSTSLMNVSGKGVKTAHNIWSQGMAEGESKLVIVHDELEKPLGAVTLNTRQGASAKGHNGLKSIMATIGNVPFVRIGIGIGRPVSRESKDVAKYVMRKMTPEEKAKIEGSVEEVIAKLKELESG